MARVVRKSGPAPGVRRPAPESRGPECAVPRAVDRRAHLTAGPGSSTTRSAAASNWSARELDIARDLLAETGHARRTSFAMSARISAAQSGRARRCRAARRSASAWRRSWLESAGRVLRARRAHHRLAPARQCRAPRYPGRSCAAMATPWWSWSTTRTPIRRADHVIDLGPGAGTRGGGSWREARLGSSPARSNPPTGRCLLRRCGILRPPPHGRCGDRRRCSHPRVRPCTICARSMPRIPLAA